VERIYDDQLWRKVRIPRLGENTIKAIDQELMGWRGFIERIPRCIVRRRNSKLRGDDRDKTLGHDGVTIQEGKEG
jgi:hypothetical protein